MGPGCGCMVCYGGLDGVAWRVPGGMGWDALVATCCIVPLCEAAADEAAERASSIVASVSECERSPGLDLPILSLGPTRSS